MEDILKWIGGTGVSGAILAFFLYKIDPRLAQVAIDVTTSLKELGIIFDTRMRSMEQAMNRQTHAELMRICTSPTVPAEVKAQAKLLIEETNKELNKQQ